MVYFKKFFTFFTIFFMILSFYFSCFAVEIPSDYYQVNFELFLENSQVGSAGFTSVKYCNTYRYKLNNGGNYIAISSPYSFNYCLSSSDLKIGDSLSAVSVGQPDSLIYIYNSGNFDYIYISFYGDNHVTLYSNANGMTSALSNLIDDVSVDSLWGVFQLAIPYILVVVLVALGIYFIVKFLVVRK